MNLKSLLLNIFAIIFMMPFYLQSATIKGTVTDAETGVPIIGAHIEIYYSTVDSSGDYSSWMVDTDSTGFYIQDSLEYNDYSIVCYSPDYTVQENANVALSNENPVAIVNFQLSFFSPIDTGSIEGYVTNEETGEPIKNAYIVIYSDSLLGALEYPQVFGLHTNSDGYYFKGNLSYGNYSINCFSPDGSTQKNSSFTMSEENPDIRIDFQLPFFNDGIIDGTVTSVETGDPVKNAHLYFYTTTGIDSTGQDIILSWYTTSDVNGYYKQASLFPGIYTIECYSPDYQSKEIKQIELTETIPSQTVNFQLNGSPVVLSFDVTIKGKVTDTNGAPLKNVYLWVWPATGKTSFYGDSLLISNDNGLYEIYLKAYSSDSSDVEIIVGAEKNGYQIQYYDGVSDYFYADRISVHSDTIVDNINFSLMKLSDIQTGGSISGQVTDEYNSGINGAIVTAINTADYTTSIAFTDTFGHYQIDNLIEGKYYVLFTADGFAPEYYNDAQKIEKAKKVKSKNNPRRIDAVLSSVIPDSTGVLIGEITNQFNQPLAGVMLTAINPEGNITSCYFTDKNGSFRLKGFAQKEYLINASRSGHKSISRQIVYNSNMQLNITLNDQTNDSESNDKNLPGKVTLYPNYPNPCNPSTTIPVHLPEATHIKITIYDILGSKIRELVTGNFSQGYHEFLWNGRNDSGNLVSSGIYFIRLSSSNNIILIRKAIFQK